MLETFFALPEGVRKGGGGGGECRLTTLLAGVKYTPRWLTKAKTLEWHRKKAQKAEEKGGKKVKASSAYLQGSPRQTPSLALKEAWQTWQGLGRIALVLRSVQNNDVESGTP